MQKIKSKLRMWLSAVCASLFILAMSLGLSACNSKNLKIDVPERIEEDLGTGTYIVPRYDVVNENGVIMAGYTVRLKSATAPNGEPAEISHEASTIVTLSGAGEYTFVFTADSGNVSDATVIMDFADRTAPTINLPSTKFPAFYIQGVTYAVPEYTLEGDFVAPKCYTKVFYNSGTGDDVEVALDDGSFLVEQSTGKYTVLIHVEDAAGNYNDYRYTRSVSAPEHYDPLTVIYFNEAFGEKQVSPDGDYAGKYVSVADGGKAYGDEAGSYKIEFNGSETTNNEAYFALNVPAITNIMEYKELEMYVYIEDGDCTAEAEKWVVGSKWWNDTSVKVGEWTRVTWSVENWGIRGQESGQNSGATTSNVISTDNITGTRIRLIPDEDYSDKTPPHGTVYFSAMRVVPYEFSQVTAGDNVTLNKRDGRYHVGDTVTLTAKEIEGKSFDCFLVDGKPISGNNFFAEKESYTVDVKYVDGKLTADNMTWGATEYVQPTDKLSSWGVYKKLGSDSNWAVQYEMTATNGVTLSNGIANAWYVGVLYRNNQIVGYEMGDNATYKQYLGSAGSGTGTTWDKISDGNLPQALLDVLNGASQENPVTLTFIRQGNTLSAYISCGDNVYCVVKDKTHSAFDEQYGLDFGYGWRTDVGGVPAIQNIRWVAGEEKTNLYLETLKVTLDLTDVTAEKESYILGDSVTLTAAEAPAGKAFAYFTVDGEKIAGDTFVATKFSHTVVAVYAEISALTLNDGVATSDGNTTVGKGSTVTLVFNGTAPAGKYFIGFSVDGNAIDGSTFEATASAHTVGAVFADRIANDDVALNDIGKATETDGMAYPPNNPGWRPSSVEYVTDFGYSGSNGTVDANNSLKVTLNGNEQSFALNNGTADLSGYKELYFYVYTQASGLKAGGWWCGDTVLTPGQWTKVSFGRNVEPKTIADVAIWENGLSQFAYRIMGGSAGTVVYVTAIYGVPYADVEVTVEENVQDYVSVSGTHKEGQEITLSVDGAPAGKKFAYFTINGERYDGTAYTLGTQNVTVGAVFTEISVLTLADGIATADGATEYARGVNVTLTFNESETPSGKLFNYFTVDGERIVGNTFETSAATHTVAVVFADSAAELTYVTSEEASGSDVTYSWSNNAYTFNGKAVGDSTSWVIEAKAYDFTGLGSKWFSLDFLVGDNASLQIRLHSAGNANIQAMGANHKDGANLTALDASVIDLCKAATAENPVTFTAIRSGDTYYVLINGELVLKTPFAFNVSGNKYGIGGTDCGTWLTDHPDVTYRYRTGEAVADYMTTVNVSGTNVTFDKANGVYKLGDTVTLTPAAAETGKAFAHYTIDGKTFSGDSFVAKKLSYEVVAVYSEISVLTLGEGIATADGETEYARGVKVVLSFDPEKLNGKVVDYYVIDKDTANEIRVYNGEFTTSSAAHTVEAVLVAPEEITWADGGTDYNYETMMGDAASEWKSRELDGEVYGSAEYWAVSVYVKHTSQWQSFEFIQGANQSIRVRFHNGGYCGVVLMTGKTNESIPSAEFTVAYPTKNEQVVNKLVAGATVTCVRNGDTISLYIDGYLFFTTNYAVDHTGNWFGVGHIDANDATKPEMSNTKFIVGQGKVEAYLATLAASGTAPSSATQINTLNGATAKDGSVVEYITEGIPEGLNDETVAGNGVLKVTAESNDVGINPGWTFDKDASAYEEIYFYVYMEEAQTNNKAGIYWAGDTGLTAATWVKVSTTNFGDASEDLSKLVLRVFRGYSNDDPAIAGKTFYITAVYGVPKTAE